MGPDHRGAAAKLRLVLAGSLRRFHAQCGFTAPATSLRGRAWIVLMCTPWSGMNELAAAESRVEVGTCAAPQTLREFLVPGMRGPSRIMLVSVHDGPVVHTHPVRLRTRESLRRPLLDVEVALMDSTGLSEEFRHLGGGQFQNASVHPAQIVRFRKRSWRRATARAWWCS